MLQWGVFRCKKNRICHRNHTPTRKELGQPWRDRDAFRPYAKNWGVHAPIERTPLCVLHLLCQLLTANDEISYSRVTRKMACLHAKGMVMVMTLSPLVIIIIPFLSCSFILPLENVTVVRILSCIQGLCQELNMV